MCFLPSLRAHAFSACWETDAEFFHECKNTRKNLNRVNNKTKTAIWLKMMKKLLNFQVRFKKRFHGSCRFGLLVSDSDEENNTCRAESD